MTSISIINEEKARVGILRGGEPVRNYILYPNIDIHHINLGDLHLVSCDEGQFMVTNALIQSDRSNMPYDVTYDSKFIYCGNVALPVYVYNLLKFNKYKWERYGGYQIISKGDNRFSAFYARLDDGRSIEEIYQLDLKGYRKFSNDPKFGKGKQPITNLTREELSQEYCMLWWIFSKNNMRLVNELRDILPQYGYTLCDKYAKTDTNQARAMADVLNTLDTLEYGIKSDYVNINI